MSFSSPPPNLPAKLRRKSSSSSINAPFSFNTDDEDLDSLSPTSPLPSSSPLSTPVFSSPPRIATRYSHPYMTFDNPSCEREMVFDDAPGSPTPSYPRGSMSKHIIHQEVISVFNKCNSLSWLSPTTPAPDVSEDDGCDLESMDIHLRKTYFATSSERGRWQSSPIIPRMYTVKPFTSSPIRPHRGHSTPVKGATQNMQSSLLEFREFVRRQSTSEVMEISRSPFLAASDSNDSEDYRSSSPLPSSSPPTSPMSLAASHLDDRVLVDDDVSLDYNDSDCSDSQQENTLTINSGTSNPDGLLTSENVASAARPSSSTYEETRQFHRISPTVPAFMNTTVPTTTAEIEPPRPWSHFPANKAGLRAYTKIPSVVTPTSKEEEIESIGTLCKSSTSTGAVSVPIDVAPVRSDDSATSQSIHTRTSSSSVLVGSSGTNLFANCDPFLATSGPISTSRVNSVKKSRLSFSSDGEFVQGSSVSQPQPARRSSISRSMSRAQDAGAIKESAKPQSEPKLKSGLKREDSIASVAPAQKKPRLAVDVDLQTRRKQRQRKPRKGETGSGNARSQSHSHMRSMESEGDFLTHVVRVHDEAKSPTGCDSQCASCTPELLDCEKGEVTGMLVEALATSRASSMDPSALYATIVQTHPHLETKYSKKEWLSLIPSVLEAGHVRCGMFEKVHSSGTSGAKQARWFYVSEKDEDRERAGLLEELMPKQKRSETKKYKQYYYKPLEKISRWDAEDAI